MANLVTKVKKKSLLRTANQDDKNTLLFILEGIAFTFTGVFSNNMSNLFITRVGASDYQLGMYTTLTSVISMLVLIPTAIFTDRLANKRKMVNIILVFMALCYIVGAVSPFLGSSVVWVLVISAAFGAGSVSLYNAIWQSYFADVVPESNINFAYAKRNQVMVFIRMALNLSVGAILTAVAATQGKIRLHQLYYFLSAVFIVLQIFFLSKIKGGDVKYKAGSKLGDVWIAAKDLAKNKKFISFAAIVVLFYMTWKLDGTIFYLSQVKYVGLSEFWLNASNTACAAAQVVSVPLWVKLNNKMGCRFGIIFGALGLVISPLCLIVPLQFTGAARIITHLILRFVSDFAFTTVTLNLFQNLLQVIGEKNKTLSIAVYNTLIALVGCFMPLVGVSIYTSFGADQAAMVKTLFIMGGCRIISLAAMFIRWFKMRKEAK